MIQRTISSILKEQLSKTKKSILLLGPRQVGKSTLLLQFNPSVSINLADEGQYRDHLRDPGLLRRLVEGATGKGPILIDEVQRYPSMLNTVQALVDEKRRSFLLSGSSARKLRHGHANLLPGRIFNHTLFPLTYWELGKNFNLDKALKIGTLPEIYLEDYGTDLLRNYIDTYLREEIQAEALARNLESFSRFIDLAAVVSGSIINYSQLASDSEIPKETLRRFYDILFDTLMIHRIPGYTDIKGPRKAIQKEMVLFFDMGVKNGILKLERNQFTDTESGKLFEQWFILQLIAFSSYYNKGWKFYYYRDDRKTEVDLILDLGSKLIALEIKFSRKPKQEYFKGVNIFASVAKKPVRSIVIHRGDRVERWGDAEAIPFDRFLSEIDDLQDK